MEELFDNKAINAHVNTDTLDKIDQLIDKIEPPVEEPETQIVLPKSPKKSSSSSRSKSTRSSSSPRRSTSARSSSSPRRSKSTRSSSSPRWSKSARSSSSKRSPRQKTPKTISDIMIDTDDMSEKEVESTLAKSTLLSKIGTLVAASIKVSHTEDEHLKFRKSLEVRSTQLTVWYHPLVLENQLLDAVSEKTFVDPRGELSKCVFIGTAVAGMPEIDILSYPFPDTPNMSFCFSVPELVEHINNFPLGNVPNKWAPQLRHVAPELASHIPDIMPDDWVEAVKWHDKALKIHQTEIKETIDVLLFNTITTAMVSYFQISPSSMTVGTVMSNIGNRIPQWLKNMVAVPTKVMYYILNNPFLVNLCVLLSKGLRAVVCAYMSGITKEDIKLMLKVMWNQVLEHPVGAIIVEIISTIFACLSDIGIKGLLGDPSGFVDCIKKVLEALSIGVARVQMSLVGFAKNFVIYLLRTLLSQILSPSTVDRIMYLIEMSGDMFTNPSLAFTYLLQGEGADDAGKQLQLMSVVREFFFANFTATFFWGFVSVLPASTLDFILAIVLPLIPAGGYVEKAKDLLMKYANKLAGTNASIGDVLIMCSKSSAMYANIISIFNEVYGWVVDVGGCFIAKYKRGMITAMKKIPKIGDLFDDTKDDISAACCFKDLVDKLKTALVVPKPPKLLTNVAQGAKATYNYVSSWLSDARLKTVMFRVFVLRVGKKSINFYLYKWTAMGARLAGSDPYSVHIGVIAQDIQKQFPEAVHVSKSGFLVINLPALPCDIRQVLHNLNGLKSPRCKASRRMKLLRN